MIRADEGDRREKSENIISMQKLSIVKDENDNCFNAKRCCGYKSFLDNHVYLYWSKDRR